MKTLLALLLSATIASAQTCPQRLNLRPVSATSRGGTIIWKSNFNVQYERENTPEEGNHAQKSAALLIHYKAKKYIRNAHTLEVRDRNCRVIAKLARFPRCTGDVCGDYERWYLRAPGSSYFTVKDLDERAKGGPVLIRLKGRQWAVVQSVYSDREIYP